MIAQLNFGGGNRIPELLQTEAAECGLVCLAMCAAAHGFQTDISTLRRRFNLSLKGVTLKQLIDIAGKLDLAARPLKLDLDELGQLALPCILHWNLNHFVVLTKVAGKRITIHDPAVGIRQMSLEEASEHFTGVALELTPTPQFRTRSDKVRVRIRDLLGNIHGLKRSLLHIGLLSLSLEVIALTMPWATQWIIDDVVVSADLDLLSVVVIALVFLGLTQTSIAAFRAWVVMYVGTHLNLQWLSNIFGHLLSLPVEYFEKRHLGDVISRFRAATEIQKTLTEDFVEAILDGIMAIFALGIMAVYSIKLALIVVTVVVIYALVKLGFYRAHRARNEEAISRAATVDSHVMESLRGVQSIKLFNFENTRRAAWFNLQVDQSNADIRQRKLDITYQSVLGALMAIENALVLWFATKLILEQQFTVGMLTAFIAYKSQFQSRTSTLIDKVFQFRLLQVQQERLADIVLSEKEYSADRALPLPLADDGLAIELDDVWYRYGDDEPWVLKGISLTVSPGTSTVIVGVSGGGKTTLLKIILGLIKPVRGTVRVNGANLEQVDLGGYRAQLATVMQEDRLFAGTVFDNVCFFDTSPVPERINDALRHAEMLDEIQGMPMGVQTFVGDMGSAFSAGQAQRILLARALYKNPGLLAMDEATSHLDEANQTRIRDHLRQAGMTRISITHRESLISPDDRVFRLNAGVLEAVS